MYFIFILLTKYTTIIDVSCRPAVISNTFTGGNTDHSLELSDPTVLGLVMILNYTIFLTNQIYARNTEKKFTIMEKST